MLLSVVVNINSTDLKSETIMNKDDILLFCFKRRRRQGKGKSNESGMLSNCLHLIKKLNKSAVKRFNWLEFRARSKKWSISSFFSTLFTDFKKQKYTIHFNFNSCYFFIWLNNRLNISSWKHFVYFIFLIWFNIRFK